MRDLYLKRNELIEKSKNLRVAKFTPNVKKATIDKLINEQNKVYNEYKFYDNYIKSLCNLKITK